MSPETAKQIDEALEAVAQMYLNAANDACRDREVYAVHEFMKEYFALQTKARNVRRRYLNAL